MPTYDYACTHCDHAFEIVQSFTDDALTVCPECGGRLRKVFGSVGVVFKGSGFYRTDSRNSSSSLPAGGKSSDGKSGEGKSGEGKSGEGKSGESKSSDSKASGSSSDSKASSGSGASSSGSGSGGSGSTSAA